MSGPSERTGATYGHSSPVMIATQDTGDHYHDLTWVRKEVGSSFYQPHPRTPRVSVRQELFHLRSVPGWWDSVT